MQKLMNKIMLSCRKATELIEKKQELLLGKREKIQLVLHLKLCSACSTYQHQSEFLNQAIRSQNPQARAGEKVSKLSLSPAKKEGILQKLREE